MTLAMDGLGISTGERILIINGMTVNGSADTAINVVATNTNIAANGSFITNNVADSSILGDGIHLNSHPQSRRTGWSLRTMESSEVTPPTD